MEQVRSIALVIHIICGFSALAMGLLAIIAQKGSTLHLLSGKIFYRSMNGVALTAIVISLFIQNHFLLLIGIFSFYQNYFGYRSVKNKSLIFNWADWVVFICGAINAIIMISTWELVLVVFGVIQANFILSYLKIDLQRRKGNNISKNTWMIQHLTLMLGSYIATVTAFLVVNFSNFQPYWLIWLAPSIVGGSIIFYYVRKYSAPVKSPKITNSSTLLVCLLGILFHQNSGAQVYVEGGNTRHRFAQLNLGIDSRYFFSNGSYSSQFNANNQLERFELGPHSDMRFIIGGTHFWGHADFYVAIPIVQFDPCGFGTSIETGGKYFPWRIEHNKIRPYVGAAMLPVNYQQGQGALQVRFRYPLTAGFVFNSRNHLIEFGLGYNYQNTGTYFIDPTNQVDFKTQPLWISFGYKFILETTLSAEKDWISGRTQKLTDTLASLKKLNGFTLAAGPSSAFFTRKSPHNQSAFPFLDDHKGIAIFGDFGIGYYLHNPDIQINAAWRSYNSSISAYGYTQEVSRKALTLEVFKFISDYHGFSAFIGPAISYEWLNIKETNPSALEQNTHFQGIKPGITFGWDIRPNRLQQIVLRTNLRYFPMMNVPMNDGKKFSFDQLEFNFIQVVVYPGRIF